MTSKKVLIASAAIAAVGLMGGSWYYLNHLPATPPPAAPGATSGSTTPATTATTTLTISDVEKTEFLGTLGQQMHAQWDARLGNPYWRMKMLNDLLTLFQRKFGADWQQELEAFLRTTFPEWADDLIKKMHALQEYNQWVEQLKSTLQFSSTKEKQTALWDKRLELFGEEAYVIWEAAYKNEQLQAKLEAVDAATGGFDEKAEQYMNAMREVFGNDIIGPDKPHATQMMTQFLQLQNVQGDLQQLPEAERYEKLREFRKAIGLNEEALQRWDTLDQERISARATGNRYMEQRALLESRYQGEALQKELNKLQDELFGADEATFVRNEESSGYYRFQQPQVIGVN